MDPSLTKLSGSTHESVHQGRHCSLMQIWNIIEMQSGHSNGFLKRGRHFHKIKKGYEYTKDIKKQKLC